MKKSFKLLGSVAVILFLFAALFSYGMFQGGFVSWFLFYSFLPLFIYQIGFIFYSLKNWKIERHISRNNASAGEAVTVTLKLRRALPFPLYFCLAEEVIPSSLMKRDNKHHKYTFLTKPEKLHFRRSVKEMLLVGFKRKIELNYTLDELPRGEHELNEVRIFISDIFGFIKKERIFAVHDRLLVYPHERELLLAEGSSIGQGSSAVNAIHLDQTDVLAGVREYAPGDRLSWIHWKQTARNNAMMTKEFEQERSTDVLLILDTTGSGLKSPLIFEAAVELSFSFMSWFERANVDAGLLALGKETFHFPIKQDRFMKEKMWSYLMKVQPVGKIPFPLLLRDKMMLADSADLNVIITYAIDDFFRQVIMEMNRRKRVVVFCIKSAKSISSKEEALISQMKNQGLAIHVLTEKELAATPLEVSMK